MPEETNITQTEGEPKKYQTILHKRGLEENLPELLESEIAFTTDKQNVYIGSNKGNVKLAKASDIESFETKKGAQEKANVAEKNAKSYVDEVMDDLIGAAPEDLDRIYELADAIQALRDQDYEALQEALACKADIVHTHAAGEITESETKKFVSTQQINKWDVTTTGLSVLQQEVKTIKDIKRIDGGTF